MAGLAERLGFDLPDPLSRDPELAADLFERPELAIFQSKAEHDDFSLSLSQFAKRFGNLRFQQLLRGKLERSRHRNVFDEVAKEGVAF